MVLEIFSDEKCWRISEQDLRPTNLQKALLKAVTSNNSEKHFEKKLYGVQKKSVICFYSHE